MRASRNEISAFPLYDCQGIDLRIGARGSSETENFKVTSMEVLLLLLFVVLIPVIAMAAIFCIVVALFLTPVILLTLPVAIPMWILAAPRALLREPAL